MSKRLDNPVHSAAVRELAELVRLGNNVEDRASIRANAIALRAMLERRGFVARLLDTASGRPAVFAELDGDGGARPTLLVYSHYDGVPPGDGWHSDPYSPILRADPLPGESLGDVVPWPRDGRFDPSWRLVGRSGADSKGSIVAVLAAVDLLNELGEAPGVRLKILLDGEEERESPSLPALLASNAESLAADAVVYSCGEVHPSGLPTVQLGTRGILVLELTAWTASSPAHSGHFGSYVPNAALSLCRLLGALKGSDGKILVEGFEVDALPLGSAELEALAETPAIDADLERHFSIHRPEVDDAPWHYLASRPTLNIRGLAAGAIGPEAANVVPHRATAELDLRLVAGMDPDAVQARIEDHLRRAGATVFRDDPTPAEIRRAPSAVTVRRLAGFPAERTRADHPLATRIVSAVRRATGGRVVVAPTDGGSLPLHLFRAVAPVVLGLPTSNSDNRQHAADENLQLRFLFRAIDVWAAVLRWQRESSRANPEPTGDLP